MSAKIIDGVAVAREIRAQIRQQVAVLVREKAFTNSKMMLPRRYPGNGFASPIEIRAYTESLFSCLCHRQSKLE